MAHTDPPEPPGWDCHVHVFDPDEPVATGHYRPKAAPLEHVEELARLHDIGHLVLVQPSVYGTNNALLLRTLLQRPGRHRGVAVVDAGVTDATLRTLHDAGVRGIRFNLVSPVGNDEADLQKLAPRLHALGWHVQWYAKAQDLSRIAALQARHRLRFVLDHYAGIPPLLAKTDRAWAALAQLADGGAWVKLSAGYRLQGHASPEHAPSHAARVAQPFGTRVVWGSDWPHTSFAGKPPPAYTALAGQVASAELNRQAAELYA